MMPRLHHILLRYLAPEQIDESGCDTTAHDMWACGCLLYILLCGYPPFGVRASRAAPRRPAAS